MAIIWRFHKKPKRHQFFCIHTERETCCYDMRDFSMDKVKSTTAKEMWNEGREKDLIKEKCKLKGKFEY